ASSVPWSLHASPLRAGGTATAPLTLVDSATPGSDTPVTLGGVWAEGDSVLVAGATASGTGVLLKIDLASGTPIVNVLAKTPGRFFTGPSTAGGTYYWAAVWLDAATGLHSIIWQMDAAGHTTQISPNEAAFHPVTLTSALAWVQVPPAALLTPTRDSDVSLPDQEREVLHGLSGALLVRDFAGGQERTLGDDVAVS